MADVLVPYKDIPIGKPFRASFRPGGWMCECPFLVKPKGKNAAVPRHPSNPACESSIHRGMYLPDAKMQVDPLLWELSEEGGMTILDMLHILLVAALAWLVGTLLWPYWR